METSPQALPESFDDQSLTCTARAEVDGHIVSLPVSLQWTEVLGVNSLYPIHHILTECDTTTGVFSSCVVNIMDTLGAHFYRCTVSYLGFSNFSDIILVNGKVDKLYNGCKKCYIFAGFTDIVDTTSTISYTYTTVIRATGEFTSMTL